MRQKLIKWSSKTVVYVVAIVYLLAALNYLVSLLFGIDVLTPVLECVLSHLNMEAVWQLLSDLIKALFT